MFGLSKSAAQQRANELLEQFQLEAHQHKKTETLSGGNKRRLHCALALVHQPRILFLDEPTVGMDPLARDNFWNTITRLNREENITIFLTTQYLEEADKHATDMALIVDGSLHFTSIADSNKPSTHTNTDARRKLPIPFETCNHKQNPNRTPKQHEQPQHPTHPKRHQQTHQTTGRPAHGIRHQPLLPTRVQRRP